MNPENNDTQKKENQKKIVQIALTITDTILIILIIYGIMSGDMMPKYAIAINCNGNISGAGKITQKEYEHLKQQFDKEQNDRFIKNLNLPILMP